MTVRATYDGGDTLVGEATLASRAEHRLSQPSRLVDRAMAKRSLIGLQGMERDKS